MQTILVTGSNGQLGQELQVLSPSFPGYRFAFFGRAELDISDAAAVHAVFEELKPHFCINCAAYTAVDKAESEIEAAYNINARGAENLALSCTAQNARLVHISTDYVFDGTGNAPYREDDQNNPLGIYGASKLEGEVLAKAAHPESIIIRTSWVYSRFGNNFVKTMVRLMASRPEINVVADQWGSPTYAADLAAAIMHIVSRATWTPGIYHFSNQGIINWYHFAAAIQKHTGAPAIVHPITTAQYPTPAARPAYSVLDTRKIVDTFGIEPRHWEEGLQECLRHLHTAAAS